MKASYLDKFPPLGFIFCVCLLFASCQAQVQSKPSTETNPPIDNEQQDFDPFFNGNTLVYSPNGPTTITRDVLQDKSGNIWLTTWEGIVRYNGSSFTNLTNEQGLRRYRAFCILEDRNDVVWIGTIGAGLYRYDPSHPELGKSGFVNVTTADGLVNNSIQCLYEDPKGILWIGTRNGLSRYDGKDFQNFSQENGMPDADVNDLVEDELGRLWIAVRGEASVFDGKTFSKLTREGNLPFVNVRSILKDKNKKLWLGGQNGLWKFEGTNFQQISPNFTGYLLEDKQGNLWQARSAPSNDYQMILCKYEAATLESASPTMKEIANPDGQVFGITEDNQGNIWFGTESGIVRYNGMSFEEFRK